MQPNYGYMSGYSNYSLSVDNNYMMPGMSGYGHPGEYYPPSFSGYGSGSMPSSFSGAGSSSQNAYPNASSYTYGYGFAPPGYSSSYGPSSV